MASDNRPGRPEHRKQNTRATEKLKDGTQEVENNTIWDPQAVEDNNTEGQLTLRPGSQDSSSAPAPGQLNRLTLPGFKL